MLRCGNELVVNDDHGLLRMQANLHRGPAGDEQAVFWRAASLGTAGLCRGWQPSLIGRWVYRIYVLDGIILTIDRLGRPAYVAVHDRSGMRT